MHSLAFAEFGKPMQHRLGKQPPMRPTERAQILGINDKYLLTAADGSGLPGRSAVSSWCPTPGTR